MVRHEECGSGQAIGTSSVPNGPISFNLLLFLSNGLRIHLHHVYALPFELIVFHSQIQIYAQKKPSTSTRMACVESSLKNEPNFLCT